MALGALGCPAGLCWLSFGAAFFFSAGFDFPQVDIFRVGVQSVQRVSSAHITAAAASGTLPCSVLNSGLSREREMGGECPGGSTVVSGCDAARASTSVPCTTKLTLIYIKYPSRP